MVVKPDDLPEAELTNIRNFSGSSLFGYMDGGAELYLEYGFSALIVMDIGFRGGRYKTEVYKMNGPEEAFGIYSVSKFKCREMPPLTKLTCLNRFQLQICKGPYYISIINGTGNSTDSIASIEIGKVITDKIGDEELSLAGYIPGITDEIIKSACFLAKGRLGIVNASPDLEDIFGGISGFTAVIANLDERRVLSVKFADIDSYNIFLKQNNWDYKNQSHDSKLKEIDKLHLLIDMPR
jgi:hypothetical protein